MQLHPSNKPDYGPSVGRVVQVWHRGFLSRPLSDRNEESPEVRSGRRTWVERAALFVEDRPARTPRISMLAWSASTTTPTPLGFSMADSQSATEVVRGALTWRRREKMATTPGNLREAQESGVRYVAHRDDAAEAQEVVRVVRRESR